MNIQLSEHFTYKKLIRFTLPSIATIVFTSVYGVVDGFFVSNFAGKIPFAALNFIMPFIMILSSFGFMFGTGGSALIAKTMGEGDMLKARRQFSFLTYFSAALGVVIAIGGIVSIRFIASVLGAKGEMLEGSVLYGRILMRHSLFTSFLGNGRHLGICCGGRTSGGCFDDGIAYRYAKKISLLRNL